MQPVLDGQRTQAEAARLLKLSTRQVRRIQQKLATGGDAALVHGLRGQPSNHRHDHALRRKVLQAYRARYPDFGPTLACEKPAEEGLLVGVETLRRWLLAEGLWERSCFGELVQMDASVHDWLEGRGEEVVLITMIDDATSRLAARFYPAGTVESHMDLLERWLDGSLAIRFGKHDLAYREVVAEESSAVGREVMARHPERPKKNPSQVWRPPADHPWRKRVVS
jgi:hypothetical protein